MTPVIDLQTRGPSEREWASVCDALPAFVWPACRRVVVVSPHPDDETLGAGGLIGTALDRGVPVLVVSVTDGEAASAAPGLADVRRTELGAALQCLDPHRSIRTLRLGVADGRVPESLAAVTREISRHLEPRDLVVCPLPDDGHPDHGASAAAAIAAARGVGATVRCYPVWAWHCHEPSRSVLVHGERLAFTESILSRKRSAAACYTSQLEGDTPVVPPTMLIRLLRPFEVLVDPR
jgi:LmbE family N-acetylglucosaminyl deacetylase